MTLAPGDRLGSYEILSAIGAGGMGEVYRARDSRLNRDVALKVLPELFAADPDRLARFKREAQLLASLNHPNIAAIYGFEENALAMELVGGPTLADRIAQGAIPLDEALPIARQIADALESAHEHGVIHRDLKPANIKVRPDGAVKVLDFGLAKALEPAATSPTATQSPTVTSPAMTTAVGMLLGTAPYMSPEQARGKQTDTRTDIWAFGCVFYEMLTGRRAFAGDDVSDVLASVLTREPDWSSLPRGLPAVLRTVVKRCLHKDRRERIGDAHTIRLALDGAFETEGSTPLAAPLPLWRRLGPVATAFIAGALLAGVMTWRSSAVTGPGTISRFEHDVPPEHPFRGNGRAVLALSPDGRHFVYNAEGGLYLRSMGSLEARLVPGTETQAGQERSLEEPAGPFFAPDGESIAYFESGQLKRIGTDGGAAFVICAAEPAFGASWSSDNTILFGQSSGVKRVSANGGPPELVIQAREGEFIYGPQLLPDADTILFTVTKASGGNRWDASQVVVQSMSSGTRTVVVQGSDARYVSTGHLIYAVDNALFAVPFDPARMEVRGPPAPVVNDVVRAIDQARQTPAANFGVSDNGTLVYLAGTNFVRSPFGRLVWVDRRGREEPLEAPRRQYSAPRLSPDGTHIAFESRDPRSDVWIWELRRRLLTRFTSDASSDILPIWSPDGQRLVWASDRGGGLVNLYSQSADGTGTIQRLTAARNSQRPSSFTPDGTRLLVAEADPTGASGAALLGMLAMDGNPRVVWLGEPRITGINAEISPNGRWLAYESGETAEAQVYVHAFPGLDQGRSQVSTSGGREPLWSRSGRELFYLAPDGTVMAAPVEISSTGGKFSAGTPLPIVAGEGYYREAAFHRGRSYDVSPDGARFLRIRLDDDTEDREEIARHFVIVENWFEELKRLAPSNVNQTTFLRISSTP